MLRTVVNISLALIIAGVFGVQWLLRGDSTQPNYRVPTNMADSVAYDAYAPNPVFPDGKTLQSPPAGSIARGYPPLHYGPSADDAIRAGAELVNPFAGVAADQVQGHLERGAAVYASFCQVCHGSTGLGDGPVTRRGVPPPPSLLADNARQLADGRLFHILTYGQNNMASYAAQISREDRWRVILYMRSLQAASNSPEPATESASELPPATAPAAVAATAPASATSTDQQTPRDSTVQP